MHERLVTESMATIVPAQEAERARRRRRSRFHSTLLLLAMAALLGYCGWVVADWRGVFWSLFATAAMLVMLRRMPSSIFLQALNARALARWEAPALHQLLDDLYRTAGVGSSQLLCWVFRPVPVAFTMGDGDKATIVLSDSLLQTMSAREIRGILTHEIIHLRSGDLALMQLAVTVGRLTRALSQIAFLLVF